VLARLVALAFVLAPALAGAQDARLAEDVVHHVMSPFCPGKVLAECPSAQAAEWRVDVHRWAAEGVGEATIRARLQARVPGFDLDRHREPEALDGVPVGAFALASLVLLGAARRFVRRRPTSPSTPDDPQDPYDERLDQELARLAD